MKIWNQSTNMNQNLHFQLLCQKIKNLVFLKRSYLCLEVMKKK